MKKNLVCASGSIGRPITYEKIPTHIYADSKAASSAVAQEIAELIREKQREGKPCVLGLATGSSPKTVYAELVRMHREEGLSFRNVVSFNLRRVLPHGAGFYSQLPPLHERAAV